MMPIEHVLAVVPVSDIERADTWYEALFGRPADNRPMPALLEWQVIGAGWVQVTVDSDRAGSGLLNLAVDDLAATREELATRGVDTAEIQPVNKGVELSATSDPDGNAITLRRSSLNRVPAQSPAASSPWRPASVNTARLWSGSTCTSSTRACPTDSSRCSSTWRSRPSLTFGTAISSGVSGATP